MSERPQTNPYAEFKAATLQGENVQVDNLRIQITGLMRFKAQEVLGSLEDPILKSFRYSRKNRFTLGNISNGEYVLNHVYAPTVAGVIRDMGWDAGSREFSLFSTELYFRLLQESIAFQKEREMDVSHLEEMVPQAEGRYLEYIRSNSISASEVDNAALLVTIFELKDSQRRGVHAAFKRSREDGLAKLREFQDTTYRRS